MKFAMSAVDGALPGFSAAVHLSLYFLFVF